LLSILVEEYRNNIQKKSNSSGNLLLYNNFDEKDLFVEADKGRIIQVISNLLANASKFTKEGSISITTRSKDSEEVIVSVKDSGTGIDPEILPRLFSKFATKSETGTGLGLFICKAIVEAHGGRIWAENNNDDKGKRGGAIFAFSLPISKQQPTTTLMSEGDKVNQ
jgi:signal transduction histidine kinase